MSDFEDEIPLDELVPAGDQSLRPLGKCRNDLLRHILLSNGEEMKEVETTLAYLLDKYHERVRGTN